MAAEELRKKPGAVVTALALVAMAVPLATTALGLAGILSPGSRLETQRSQEQYRSQALENYLRSRLEAPQGWQNWVSATVEQQAPAATGPTKPPPSAVETPSAPALPNPARGTSAE